MRLVRTFALLALFPAALSAQMGSGSSLAGAALVREPTLVYDVTGSTLVGPVHTSLVVYNDGSVSYSTWAYFTGDDGSALGAVVPKRAVRTLTNELDAAGAFGLPDAVGNVADLPTTTVTFMKPGTDTVSHTYSVAAGSAGHTAVTLIILDFIDTHITPSIASTITTGLIAASHQGALGAKQLIPGLALKQEPVLIYDVTGSTFAGPIHKSAVVYNNGLISFCEFRTFLGDDGFATTALATPAEVHALSKALVSAGGFSLTDSVVSTPDLPVSTVTVMRGQTDSKSHAFSYQNGGMAYDNVGILIESFLAQHVGPPLTTVTK